MKIFLEKFQNLNHIHKRKKGEVHPFWETNFLIYVCLTPNEDYFSILLKEG